MYFLARSWQGSAAVYTWRIRELSGKWNEREERAYRHYLEEKHRDYREWGKARREEQRDYWKWRHEHSDAILFPEHR